MCGIFGLHYAQELEASHGAGIAEANEVLGAFVSGAVATVPPTGSTPCKKVCAL